MAKCVILVVPETVSRLNPVMHKMTRLQDRVPFNFEEHC